MIKALSRLGALLLLCLLLVYAPEILTAVSAPYSVHVPERALLRMVLCCEDDSLVSSIYKAIQSYQKLYPSVHLRIMRISAGQLSAMLTPYPDVLLFPPGTQSNISLEATFETPALICAVHGDSREPETAAHFAAYLYEAIPSQNGPSDF